MLSGLAISGAVRHLGVTSAHLDWPNDVVVDGAKLSGILVESRGLEPGDPIYVVGIGLNVAQRDFSPELLRERAVTSLALQECDCGIERAAAVVLEELSHRFDALHQIPAGLGAEYLDETGLRGERVTIQIGSEMREGLLSDLTIEGGLVLTEAGERKTMHALEHVRSLQALKTS